MTPMGYIGIAVIIGGGYMSIKQLQSLYTKGCHTPAMYLIGSIGTIGIGLWVLRNHGASPEPTDEEEAEWME
jgi:hypothetical protein